MKICWHHLPFALASALAQGNRNNEDSIEFNNARSKIDIDRILTSIDILLRLDRDVSIELLNHRTTEITENLTGTNPRTTKYKYDQLGRSIETTDAANHSTLTTYDQAGNIRTSNDANNSTVESALQCRNR